MTNPNPTTTAQATVLSAAELDRLWQRMQSVDADNRDVSWVLTWAEDIIASHRALTEQVRVLRPVVEWYADPTNYRDEDVAAYGYRARRALAALEGSGE